MMTNEDLFDLLDKAASDTPSSMPPSPSQLVPRNSMQNSRAFPDWLIPIAMQLLGFVAWWLMSGVAYRQGFAGTFPLLAWIAVSAATAFAPEATYKILPPPVLIGFAFGEQLLQVLMRLGARRP